MICRVAIALAVAAAALLGGPSALRGADQRPAPRPAGASFKDCPHCPEMIAVAPGGVTSEGLTPRRVTIAYRLAFSKARVSQRDWKACVLANQCPALGATAAAGLDPVLQASWLDVQQYLAWLGLETGAEYRLLSEAEWEYLARSPAGRTAGLADGLEWTSDCWHADLGDAPADGSSWDTDGDCRYHVARGRRPGDGPAAGQRYRFLFNARDAGLGFRVARTLGD